MAVSNKDANDLIKKCRMGTGLINVFNMNDAETFARFSLRESMQIQEADRTLRECAEMIGEMLDERNALRWKLEKGMDQAKKRLDKIMQGMISDCKRIAKN